MMTSGFRTLLVAITALALLPACKKSEPVAEAPAPAAETAPAEGTAPEAPVEQPAPTEAAPVAPPPVEAPAPVALTPTAAALPGAAEVQAALARKDYSSAVVLLARVKVAAGQDRLVEYNDLMRQVRGAIVDAMDTDPNAKRAFDAMRAIVSGR